MGLKSGLFLVLLTSLYSAAVSASCNLSISGMMDERANSQLLEFINEPEDFKQLSQSVLGEGKSRFINRMYELVKRSADITIVLIAAPPALAAVAVSSLAVKLDSKGPVFFFQSRAGRDGKAFQIIKLRTMKHMSSEPNLPYTLERDPRITNVGYYLRRWKIDELPQLLNILRGEMSIVGPRPVNFEVFERASAEVSGYPLRLLVKPGLTGLAQINCHECIGSGLNYEEKFQHDLYYVRHRSLLLDLKIIVKTLAHLLRGRPLRVVPAQEAPE